MSYTDADREANDRRVAHDVATHGCHVISVFDPEEKTPTFSYSIGIEDSAGVPDVLVIGLSHKLGHSIINHYCRTVREGTTYARGVRYDGFLEGFPVLIEPVRARRHAEYTMGCERYYRDRAYRVAQIIWPNTNGVWPWQKGASEWLVANQPMLGRLRPDKR